MVVEAARNIACSGAEAIGLTNCLNFGSPEKEEVFYYFDRVLAGMSEAARALNLPITGGNVSLYNETDGKAIQPTPAIGGVGLLKDLTKRVNTKFKNIGDVVLVIGKTSGHLNCSLFEREILKTPAGKNE